VQDDTAATSTNFCCKVWSGVESGESLHAWGKAVAHVIVADSIVKYMHVVSFVIFAYLDEW